MTTRRQARYLWLLLTSSLLAATPHVAHAQDTPSEAGPKTAPPAALTEQARALYDEFVAALRRLGVHVETGVFQAMMEVELVNDGPVTVLVDTDRQSY